MIEGGVSKRVSSLPEPPEGAIRHVERYHCHPFRQPEAIDDPLSELAREGARRMLAQVLIAEADSFVAMWKDLKLPDGHDRVVRHGHGPHRAIQTGVGPVELHRAKVRDRGDVGAEEKIRFTSSILPKWARRTKSLDALLPVLYLRGVSTGDFQETRRALGQGRAKPVAGGDLVADGRMAGGLRRLAEARPLGETIRESGVAHDEPGRQDDPFRSAVSIRDPSQKQERRFFTYPMRIDRYSGQGRAGKRRVSDIVEANDAEVARQPPTALDKAEDNPKGAHVVVADCSRWRVIAPEKFTNCPSPVLARRRATHDWARLKLSLAKRPVKSRQALARRGGTTSRADIGDPSVSQSDQMFDCQLDARLDRRPHVVISATTDVAQGLYTRQVPFMQPRNDLRISTFCGG
jgi:hypothetical protein